EHRLVAIGVERVLLAPVAAVHALDAPFAIGLEFLVVRLLTRLGKVDQRGITTILAMDVDGRAQVADRKAVAVKNEVKRLAIVGSRRERVTVDLQPPVISDE